MKRRRLMFVVLEKITEHGAPEPRRRSGGANAWIGEAVWGFGGEMARCRF